MANNSSLKSSDKSSVEFRRGFTFSSSLAVLYAIFVFVPSTIYLQLMVGAGGIPVSWFTVVLFVELARLLGHRISKQEATMIFLLSSAVLLMPLDLIYRGYLRTSEIAKLFGIAEEIPTWYAPNPMTGVYELRTFFHPSWAIPITIYVIEVMIGSLSAWGLGFLARKFYIEEEKLPFPIQQISSAAIITLTEEEKGGRERARFLFFVSIIGFIYGFIVYALPFVVKAYAGVQLTIIPVPWFDLTSIAERYFPGAIFGVATDLGSIATSFVLSIPMIISIIVGSFAVYFFGNWLSVRYNLAIQPWWLPQMPIQMALQRCILYFWGIPIMGFGMAGGLMPVILRYLRRRSIKKTRVKGNSKRMIQEIFSLKTYFLIPLLVMWAWSIFLYLYLAPNFPFWLVFPLIIVVPIVSALVDGRMLGETGTTFIQGQTGNLLRIIYWSSGYQGVDVWFVPAPWGRSGAGVLGQMKVCELTDTSVKDLFKMYWIFLPIGILVGFLYVQLFWSIAPIPSGRYPATEIFWPINAVNTCLWIRGMRIGLFRVDWLIESFLVGSVLAILFDVFKLNRILPFIGIVAGSVTTPPFAVTYGIGLLLRIFLQKTIGKQKFEEMRQLIAAGLLMGQGVAIMIGISLILIINSIWFMPY